MLVLVWFPENIAYVIEVDLKQQDAPKLTQLLVFFSDKKNQKLVKNVGVNTPFSVDNQRFAILSS